MANIKSVLCEHPSRPFYAKQKCERCYWREYRSTHPAYVAQQRTYRAEHREQTRRTQGLWRTRNRERERVRTRAWDAAHPERRQDRRRKAEYGLTREAYDALVAGQAGHCAICDRVPEAGLVVDHDHETGQARGLLCRSCNTALGLLGENHERIARLVAYLEAHE